MWVLLKMLALWGIGDGVWMSLNPGAWSRFWGGAIRAIGRGGTTSRLAAFAQVLLCIVLVKRLP